MPESLLDFVRVYMPQRTKEIDYDTPLIDSGLLDSLMLMQLIAFLEKGYAVEIPPTDVVPQNFGSLGRSIP